MQSPIFTGGVFRTARPGDVEAVSALYQLLGREQPIDSTELAGFLARPDQQMALCVLRDGSTVWLVAWTTWDTSLSFPRPVCFIQDLVVLPTARRRGVGTALLRHVRQWGQDHGIRVFHLQASAGKPGLKAFYRRNKFEVKGHAFYLFD